MKIVWVRHPWSNLLGTIHFKLVISTVAHFARTFRICIVVGFKHKKALEWFYLTRETENNN